MIELTIVMFLSGFMGQAAAETQEGEDSRCQTMSLDQCIDTALENNRSRRISQLAVDMAEAQHRQALSARWPQAAFSSMLTRRDEDPLFIFPEETDLYSLAMGGAPVEIPITIPEKRIELMDRTHLTADIDFLYPLYTAGRRGAVMRQTEAGLTAAKLASRRTDLRVIYDVKRMYWGALLARQLSCLGQEALARLEVTLELTEHLYQQGAGRITRMDYLQHQVVVESLRSLVARLETNARLSRAALANTVGWSWNQEVAPVATEIPYLPYAGTAEELVVDAYEFNPDWKQLQASLDAAAAKVDEVRSARMPTLMLIGRLQAMANAHDKGIVGPEERRSWLVGVSMKLPLFDGLLTRNRIRAARARLAQVGQQRMLLQEGLGLQIKTIFLQQLRAQNQEQAARAALVAAEENRQLTIRAYRSDLVDVREVIEAQLLEAAVRAQYLSIRYGHAQARAQLEFVVGRELDQRVAPKR